MFGVNLLACANKHRSDLVKNFHEIQVIFPHENLTPTSNSTLATASKNLIKYRVETYLKYILLIFAKNLKKLSLKSKSYFTFGLWERNKN